MFQHNLYNAIEFKVKYEHLIRLISVYILSDCIRNIGCLQEMTEFIERFVEFSLDAMQSFVEKDSVYDLNVEHALQTVCLNSRSCTRYKKHLYQPL